MYQRRISKRPLGDMDGERVLSWCPALLGLLSSWGSCRAASAAAEASSKRSSSEGQTMASRVQSTSPGPVRSFSTFHPQISFQPRYQGNRSCTPGTWSASKSRQSCFCFWTESTPWCAILRAGMQKTQSTQLTHLLAWPQQQRAGPARGCWPLQAAACCPCSQVSSGSLRQRRRAEALPQTAAAPTPRRPLAALQASPTSAAQPAPWQMQISQASTDLDKGLLVSAPA